MTITITIIAHVFLLYFGTGLGILDPWIVSQDYQCQKVQKEKIKPLSDKGIYEFENTQLRKEDNNHKD